MRKVQIPVLILIFISIIACNDNLQHKEIKMLEKKISQYAPTEIKYDKSLLNENQKKVINKLYQASKIIDEIYLDQVYAKNYEIKENLLKSEDPIDKLRLLYFDINFGPFDRLDHDQPFIGTTPKPLGANFYPEDMTKDEFENWIKNNPEDERYFTSEFTMIRRDGDKLRSIPYYVYYHDKLQKISKLLNEAAEYADNPSLKKYLTLCSEAMLTDDFFKSDMAWMDLKNHEIEVVIGPYEVYEDALFNYKASYESFITIVDPVATKKLQEFSKYLKDMEDNLPLPKQYKNYKRGNDSPIVVVQEVFSAGDSKAGIQTLAFNLPNDERVRKVKGSKKVMLKNLHEAKFEKLLKPIAAKVLDKDQLQYLSFDGFFTHTLMHEMSHGIGPGIITVNGKQTEVKKELKETYSKIEECKADILGMYNNKLLVDKGVLPKTFENQMWVTFLAGIFRSVRFGINEAHGGGNAIIYNYLLENGGYEFDEKTEKVRVNFEKIYPALKELANKILMIQAKGDYQGSLDFIAKYGIESPSMQKLVNKLSDLPVDIKPEYQIEKELSSN